MQGVPLKPEDVNVPKREDPFAAPTLLESGQSVKRYNDFTWWVDSAGWTTVGDYDQNKLGRWMRTLDEHEVVIWCDGYEQGHRHGIEKGKNIKAHEVKRALGL